MEKLHKKFKICILHLNRVRIKGGMAGNYTSFEENLNTKECWRKEKR